MTQKSSAGSPYYAYGLLHRSEAMQRWLEEAPDDFKQYRKDWSRRVEELDPGDGPINANIEVTTRCNMACTFCYNPYLPESQIGDLSFERFKSYIDSAIESGLKSINLNGLGEPLLRSDLPEMIAYAKSKGVLETMFHTNVSIMTPTLAKRLVDSGLDKIIFSVDSPDKDTYQSVRLLKRSSQSDDVHKTSIVPMDPNKIRDNVLLFKNIRDELGSVKPFIRTTMVLTDDNEQFVDSFLELWRDISDEVSVQDMVSNSKDFGGKLWKNQQRSRVFDSREQLLQACKEEGVKFICPVLYQSGYFYNNGDIVKCSYPGAREGGVLSNIDSSPVVGDLWHSDEVNRLRKLHNEGLWYQDKMCEKCDLPYVELASYFSKSHTSSVNSKKSNIG